jgi:hypothetical protein
MAGFPVLEFWDRTTAQRSNLTLGILTDSQTRLDFRSEQCETPRPSPRYHIVLNSAFQNKLH